MLSLGEGALVWPPKDSLRGCDAMILLTTAATIVAYDTTIGFLAGLALALVLRCRKNRVFQRGPVGREIVDVDERLQLRVDVAQFLDGDTPRYDTVEEQGDAVTSSGQQLPDVSQDTRVVDGRQWLIEAMHMGEGDVKSIRQLKHAAYEPRFQQRRIASADESEFN